jgi:DNA-binding CsgD family transcriptional regulator
MITRREKQVLSLVAIGFSADEIGDALFISPETARKTICNMKIKLRLSKVSELTAYYWCEAFGTSFEEKKRQVLLAVLSLVLIFAMSVDIAPDKNRTTRTSRNARAQLRRQTKRENELLITW